MTHELRLSRLEKTAPHVNRSFVIDVVKSSPLTYQRTDTGEYLNSRQFAEMRSRYHEAVFIIDDITGGPS